MPNDISDFRNTLISIYLTLNEREVAQIPTTRGLFAIVDVEFAEKVMRHRWYANLTGNGHVYAVADIKGKRVSLQRLIRHYLDESRPVKDIVGVTFKNKCSLDCRASNLVEIDGRQSMMRNRKPKKTSASKYKGLRKRSRSNGSIRWDVGIRIPEGDLYLGSYDNEEHAAIAYDAAAFLFFAGSAKLNFPDSPPSFDALANASARYARLKNKQQIDK